MPTTRTGRRSGRGRSAKPDAPSGTARELAERLSSVRAPKLPCFKLGLKFGNPKMVKAFALAGRTGTYLRIVEEGALEAGDAIEVGPAPGHGVTVALIAEAFHRDRGLAERMLDAPQLPDHWRAWALDPASPV
jgi:MOSC domain-containing protein YiiM